jgi:hypothetical protein
MQWLEYVPNAGKSVFAARKPAIFCIKIKEIEQSAAGISLKK